MITMCKAWKAHFSSKNDLCLTGSDAVNTWPALVQTLPELLGQFIQAPIDPKFPNIYAKRDKLYH